MKEKEDFKIKPLFLCGQPVPGDVTDLNIEEGKF